MDLSPLGHAVIAVCLQVIVGTLSGNWWLGGAHGCLWFIAREHTQSEYRWIAKFGHGKRANMPWWGVFDWRVWDMASFLDWLVPVITCSSVYFVISF